MTEQQIDQLKSLLKESTLANELEQSSKDLDEKLLRAAQTRNTQQVKAPNVAIFGLPFSVLGTVSLAVVFTTGLFLGMSQMILPEERAMVLNGDSKLVAGKLITREAKVKDLIEAPEHAVTSNAPVKSSRDRILVDFDLPSASELIAQMEFNVEQDRADTQAAIDIAMLEISTMIELGTFDNARERYAMLLESCQPCSLPTTLEALVLDASVPSKTG